MISLLRHGRLDWQERRRMNEAVPDVDQAISIVYEERIDEFLARIARADDELTWPAHWLHHDEESDNCENYCLTCVRAEASSLNAEHVARRAAEGRPVDQEDEDDAAPWSIRGGDDREDGTAVCSICGAMLDYYLSEHTIEDEAHHFLEQRPEGRVTSATEAVEIARLLEAAKKLGPIENDFVERCIALIDQIDLDAVDAEIAARKAGTWGDSSPPPNEPIALAA